jgi:L-ribulose-5-phosphate 4-epimerase
MPVRGLRHGRTFAFHGGGVARTEGVIQFRFDLEAPQGTDFMPPLLLGELNAVRDVLRDLRLVGVDARTGLGYGNLSARLPAHAAFYITASQTAGAARLYADDICRIDDWDPDLFHVRATGMRPPSSEALTHAMIYAGDERTSRVLHAHSAAIWHAAEGLGLPATPRGAGYGSPAMARAVQALLGLHTRRPLVFVTPGHEDGVFAVGADAAATVAELVATLVRARRTAGRSPDTFP